MMAFLGENADVPAVIRNIQCISSDDLFSSFQDEHLVAKSLGLNVNQSWVQPDFLALSL